MRISPASYHHLLPGPWLQPHGDASDDISLAAARPPSPSALKKKGNRPMPQPDPPTIAVTARSRSRFARLKVRRPGTSVSRLSRVTQAGSVARPPLSPPAYTPDLAMQLLGRTCQLPASKRGLLTVLAEYRRALHDLATSAPTG